jgi:hypothetical protein
MSNRNPSNLKSGDLVFTKSQIFYYLGQDICINTTKNYYIKLKFVCFNKNINNLYKINKTGFNLKKILSSKDRSLHISRIERIINLDDLEFLMSDFQSFITNLKSVLEYKDPKEVCDDISDFLSLL